MINFYNPPFLGKFKTIVGSYTQIIAGLLMSVVELLNLVNDCVNGATGFEACLNNLPLAFMGVVAAANGLAQLGIGHKIEKQNAADPALAAAADGSQDNIVQ